MRRLAALASLFWLSVAVAFVAWWRATVPRRREIPARWAEPEDGVQVDPWPAELLWSGPTDYEYTLSRLGHDPLPHTPSNWTPCCRRCDMLQERLLHDIRTGEPSIL